MNDTILGVTLGMVIIIFFTIVTRDDNWTKADPYAQSSFVCEEDEVLGFSQEFGPDRVGCISLDQFRQQGVAP